MNQHSIKTPQYNTNTPSRDKLFYSICLGVSLITAIRLVSYYFLEIYGMTIVIDAISFVLFSAYFYLSKYKGYFKVLTWPFFISSDLLLLSLWFSLGGINGPVIAIFMTALITNSTLIDNKHQWKIAVMIAFTIVLAVILEYYFPHWVMPYPTTMAQAFDTCLIGIGATCLITLSNNYSSSMIIAENERVKAKSKELEIARKEAERNHDLLSSLKELQSSFFLEEDLEASFDKLLNKLLSFSESEYGFIGEVMHENGQPYLKTHALTNIAWNDETRAFFEAHAPQGLEFKNLDTLFGYVLRHQKHIISNNPSNDPRKGGLPKGHPSLDAFLGLPVVHNNEMIGMVGIANRKGGYNEEWVQFLMPFLSTYATIIQNIRLKRIQKKYEKELQLAKETAEASVRRKSQFLTNISHELRTPLSLIIGPVSALLRQPANQLSEQEVRKSLSMIQDNSNKMLSFIEDIMDLAKLNSNKLELEQSKHHFYSFIQGIYALFKIQTTYRKIDYRLEYSIDPNLVLKFDGKKIEKIINNLLSNAFKFTKNDGQIVLSIGEAAGHIRVEVRDTGVGIHEDDLPYIFDRFYQTKNTGSSIFSGTGVGLALSQELARLHGFRILATSILGKGSCFSFLLPITDDVALNVQNIKEVQQTDTSEEIAPPKSSDKPVVLIVEDSLEMRQFLEGILSPNYHIVLAENGAVGLKTLQKNPTQFDLVVTDLMMPEMDGFELLSIVKQQPWAETLPIIVLTAKTGDEARLKALTIGVNDYLVKPFSVDELFISMEKVLKNNQNKKEWLSPNKTEEQALLAQTEEAKISIKIDHPKLKLAQEVVLKNLDNIDFAVDDLAQQLVISKRQLYRFTQMHTGLTPLKFIKEIRLQKAREYLENKSFKTVKEVAYACGFGSAQHFTKNYLAHFGKKPSTYLKN